MCSGTSAEVAFFPPELENSFSLSIMTSLIHPIERIKDVDRAISKP